MTMRASFRPVVLSLVFVLGAACGDEKEAAPVLAAKQFAAVLQSGDAKALIAMMDVGSAARLEQSATRASDQVGGRRNIEMYEMVQIVDVPVSQQIAKGELIAGDDREAKVALTAADGTTHYLDMVYQEGSWRVRLPSPGPRNVDEAP